MTIVTFKGVKMLKKIYDEYGIGAVLAIAPDWKTDLETVIKRYEKRLKEREEKIKEMEEKILNESDLIRIKGLKKVLDEMKKDYENTSYALAFSKKLKALFEEKTVVMK